MIVTDTPVNKQVVKRNTWGRGNEEIRRSLDVLDRVLSEFDDIETDTGDEGGIIDVEEASNKQKLKESLKDEGEHDSDSEIEAIASPGSSSNPPPVDRTLKPQGPSPPALPQKARDKAVKQTIQDSEGSFQNSSDNSHEYQEINSDLITSPTLDRAALGKKRQSSVERNRRRGEMRSRRQQQRDFQGSSSDITTLEGPVRPRISKDDMLREKFSSPVGGGKNREGRHLRKSRSDINFERRDMDATRRSSKSKTPRRSKSTDRLLESRDPPFEPYMDARLFDPRLYDPRMIDPRLIDPNLVDPRLYDSHMMDPIYPMEENICFPHLLGYPMPPPNALPLEGPPMQPMPPGLPPQDYPPGYNMFPYDYHPYLHDQLVPGDHVPTVYDPIMIGPPPGGLPPIDIPADYRLRYPMDFPVDYPLDYPLEYGNYPPELLPWNLPRGEGQWTPAEEAQMLVDRAVRQSARVEGDEVCDLTRSRPDPRVMIRNGRRLTSVGHSDSSERSSPLEERHPRGGWRGHPSEGVPSEGASPREPPGGVFRLGEPVRGMPEEALTTRVVTSSTSMPHFTGKDSGFDEGIPTEDIGSNSTGKRKVTPGGGGFIVSGVFNDSSKMYIPAPPSPTPDYDDDGGDSDGNESDILHDSQFYVVNDDPRNPKRLTSRNPKKISSQTGKSEIKKSETKQKSKPTPFQNMMNKFHQRLPHLEAQEEESRFSDDSLDGSSAMQSTVSGSTIHPRHKQTSLESLVSIEESTTSFDYVTSKHSKLNREANFPIISGGENGMFKGSKELGSKLKTSKSKTEISARNKLTNREKSKTTDSPSRQNSRESNQSSSSSSSKRSDSFDTIRTMLKQGLIEGLDESPPDFKPPPASETTMSHSTSEERTDSGLGSNRTDESGTSDNHSNPSTSPPSLMNSLSVTPTSVGPSKNGKFTRNQMIVKTNIQEDEETYNTGDDSSPPPLPPPRDSSMGLSSSPGQSGTNPSWLHNNRPPNASKNGNFYGKKPAVPPPRSEMLEVPHSSLYSRNPGKITHVDDLYAKDKLNYNQDLEDNPLTDREFLENLKNLESNQSKGEKAHVITDDRTSIGSRSSTRSSRLLSRFTDTMKNSLGGSRPSTPSNTTKTTTKLTSSSRSSTRLHADVIREPWRQPNSLLPSPLDYPPLVNPSTIVPLSRDGSGRFRSIEDLTDAASIGRSDNGSISEKRKKHSTLPPNLTPADMKRENKELRRATSLMCGNKGKDESEGNTRFKFNIFKGLWRRRQYSFDNKM